MILGELLRPWRGKRSWQRLREELFLHDVTFERTSLALLITNGVLWLLFILAGKEVGSGPLVLHYSVYRGTDLLGSKEMLYLLPLSGSIVILANFVLARILYRVLRPGSYILMGTAFIVQFLIIFSLVAFSIRN